MNHAELIKSVSGKNGKGWRYDPDEINADMEQRYFLHAGKATYPDFEKTEENIRKNKGICVCRYPKDRNSLIKKASSGVVETLSDLASSGLYEEMLRQGEIIRAFAMILGE